MSFLPNSARVSSISPEARINRFPSAGSISTSVQHQTDSMAWPHRLHLMFLLVGLPVEALCGEEEA